jgi:hypothetical protein
MLPEIPEWMTDELLRAEAAVDEAAYAMSAAIERSYQTLEGLDGDASALTDEDVARFREACLSSPASDEWRRVAERVACGELTWRSVMSGEAGQDDDVMAALKATFEKAADAEQSRTAEVDRYQPESDMFDDDVEYFSSGKFLR